MSGSPDFVYTTYIRTTPERLWQAITDPVFSERYMGHAIVSDWEKGSQYVWADGDLKIAHPEQVILEADPYRRLAFTFHTFVPELTELGIDADTVEKAAAERRSKVTFEIEPVDNGMVKLTVTHDDFPAESTVRGSSPAAGRGSWPTSRADWRPPDDDTTGRLGTAVEAALQEMLVTEKQVMRARDALAAQRRRMPWLAVERTTPSTVRTARSPCSTCSKAAGSSSSTARSSSPAPVTGPSTVARDAC